jgi:hypothetical protein
MWFSKKPKAIACMAGEWTTLISNFGSGMPARWTISLEATDPGVLVSGEFYERRHFWIFPQAPVTGPLQPRMVFTRYWINAIYVVKIKPDFQVTAVIDGGVLG